MNPLIERQGVCDPHIHIYEGKAYLYATHDNFSPGRTGFEMTEWQIWSSEDLVHWTLERTEKPEDFYCGPIDQCWAVDAAFRDGKYYWYFSEGAKAVGVGVSDSPAGPFKEALGHYLVGPQTPPVNVSKWDPCVFVDDDGEAYLICGSTFGTDEYLIARLNPDMCSLAEPLREIEYIGTPNREDKASIHKENGIYYLTHASFYATSDNVYGPYVYRGNTGANVDHGSFFTYRGQTYQASGGLDNPSNVFRASYLAYCHYRKNGDIVVDQVPIAYGVGQYDAGWRRIEAEWFFECSQAVKQEISGGGFGMGELTSESWLHFPNLNHMNKNAVLTVRYANLAQEGLLEIREGSCDGTLLGSCALPGTGSGEKFETAAVQLSNDAGPHSLFLVVKDGNIILDWFAFDMEKNHSNAEAARGVLKGEAAVKACDFGSNGQAVSLTKEGDGVQLFLDGGAGGECSWTIRYQAAGEAALQYRVNGGEQRTLELPGAMTELSMTAYMEPGINAVELYFDAEAKEPVLVDSLRVETDGNRYRSYAAGNGIVEPMGNGCWNGLPQRESDRYAFSGRCVCHLEQPGHRITIPDVDGGENGGKVRIKIRYGNGGDKEHTVRLKANGIWGDLVTLPPTGGVRMEDARTAESALELKPGRNRVVLMMNEQAEPGICIDAVSVVPAE